mmetsp:Transcript_14642/g.48546  ORF Transcript_14642/g.48546 Transcript_14642/m.48546 type:complete len:292 (-) Transcript_14642:98-973(-)
MHRHRLHPRVVRVARVVDVAAVHHLAVRKQLVDGRVEGGALGVGGHVARLLGELAPHRHRHNLARVHHPARQRPDARVAALDGDNLQLPLVAGLPARHDRVGGPVGPPLAEHAPPAHAGAAARVDWPLVRVEEEGALAREAVLELREVRPRAVGPAVRVGVAPLGREHRGGHEGHRRVLWPGHLPAHLCVLDREARRVLRVLLRPRVHVRRGVRGERALSVVQLLAERLDQRRVGNRGSASRRRRPSSAAASCCRSRLYRSFSRRAPSAASVRTSNAVVAPTLLCSRPWSS